MKFVHSFKDYNRRETLVVTKKWRSKEYKNLAGLYDSEELSENDCAIIFINSGLLKFPKVDRELAITLAHEMGHVFFPEAGESRVEEFASKLISLMKKFGFSLVRDRNKQ